MSTENFGSPCRVARPKKHADLTVPAYSAAIRAARGTESQERFARRAGIGQQTLSGVENGSPPSRRTIKKLIAVGVPAAAFSGAGVQRCEDAREGSTAVRRELFRKFFGALRSLYGEFGAWMEDDDLAWRAYSLWMRALLLDHPETLAERSTFVLEQERQRLKREQ